MQLPEITRRLEDEGVEKFNKPFDKLMETLKEEVAKVRAGSVKT